MKHASALAALLALVTLSPSQAAAQAPLLPERVEAAVHERVAAGQYPALVVAVVDGERSGVYGFGDLGHGKAPDAHTVFEIGSVTKTFTGLLLADAVSLGALQLDTPLASLLPGFAVPSRGGKAITLENLATQHSGLPRLPGNLQPTNAADPYADYDGARLKSFLASYTLTVDPGSRYTYSNLGMGLLGYALAENAGSTYATLLQQRIFAPLDMGESAVDLDAAMRARLAPGHGADGEPAGHWMFAALAGAGAISSTGADMLRYLKANMGQSKSPLDAAMALAHKARADGPDRHERMGLAWMTRQGSDGNVIWHNGMTGGYASFIGFTADGSRGVVVLANVQRSVDDLGFATLLTNAPLAPTHTRMAMDAAALDAYVGSYQLAPGFVLSVFRGNDQLYAQATGQGPLPIFPRARDEFFAEVADIAISFGRDANGRVDGLVLHQNGDHAAPRLSKAQAEAASGQREVSLDKASLADYVGRYQLASGAVFVITLDGAQLMARLADQPAFPVYARARDEFFYKVVDAQLSFSRDAGGTVNALVLHQNGADQRATRVGD